MKSILFQVLLIACLLFGSCYAAWCLSWLGPKVPIAENGAKVRKAASTNSGIEATLDIEDEDGDPNEIRLMCWTKGQPVSAYAYGKDEWVKVCYKGSTFFMHDGVLDCNNNLCRDEYGLEGCNN